MVYFGFLKILEKFLKKNKQILACFILINLVKDMSFLKSFYFTVFLQQFKKTIFSEKAKSGYRFLFLLLHLFTFLIHDLIQLSIFAEQINGLIST